MKLYLRRKPTAQDWMFGALYADEIFFCYTCEDELREVKIHGETAIPAGIYRVDFANSPKFGPNTLTLFDVKGFSHIRIHGGNDDDDTEGCILVGNRIDEQTGKISGAKVAGVLQRLKNLVKAALDSGETVLIEIINSEGDCYVDSGNVAAV